MDYLGSITPTKDGWLSLVCPINATGAVLQFTSPTGNFDDVLSWGLIRRSWLYEGQKLNQKPQKIYPDSELLLIPIPSPPPQLLMDAVSSELQILKIYRKVPFENTEPRWSVDISVIG